MKIKFQPVPSAARDSMEAALKSVTLPGPGGSAPSLVQSLREHDQIALPLITLTSDRAVHNLNLRAFKIFSWTFVVYTSETDRFNSEYSLANVSDLGRGYRFTHLQHGWIPYSLLTTLEAASDGLWRKSGTFTPALLHISGLRMFVIWFRGSNPRFDSFVPLLRQPKGDLASPYATPCGLNKFLYLVDRRRAEVLNLKNAPLHLAPPPPLYVSS